jgi:hypothetical protein
MNGEHERDYDKKRNRRREMEIFKTENRKASTSIAFDAFLFPVLCCALNPTG